MINAQHQDTRAQQIMQRQMHEFVQITRKTEQELQHLEALEASGFFSRLENKLALDFAMAARNREDEQLKQVADIYRGACMVVNAIQQMRESHENVIAQAKEQGRERV